MRLLSTYISGILQVIHDYFHNLFGSLWFVRAADIRTIPVLKLGAWAYDSSCLPASRDNVSKYNCFASLFAILHYNLYFFTIALFITFYFTSRHDARYDSLAIRRETDFRS